MKELDSSQIKSISRELPRKLDKMDYIFEGNAYRDVHHPNRYVLYQAMDGSSF
jgi:hypothetical protein